MSKPQVNFMDIASEIRRVTSLREQLVLEAFEALTYRHNVLAQTLIESVGSRHRAAHWMCTSRRAFDGRSAYDVLADGYEDIVWDQLTAHAVDTPVRTPETDLA
jgi:hypothetical protein